MPNKRYSLINFGEFATVVRLVIQIVKPQNVTPKINIMYNLYKQIFKSHYLELFSME